MRSVMRLIGVLAAVLLFAVPVLGISAQGGQLPVTGSWDDGIFVPSNLPAPGETELTIGELTPSALPVTGTSAQPTGCAQFWGMTDPDGFYSHECDNAGALSGTRRPSALPRTGVNMSGLTEQNRQTFLNEIAGGVRNITEILPEELAAIGR